jgi:hypothetical protein
VIGGSRMEGESKCTWEFFIQNDFEPMSDALRCVRRVKRNVVAQDLRFGVKDGCYLGNGEFFSNLGNL